MGTRMLSLITTDGVSGTKVHKETTVPLHHARISKTIDDALKKNPAQHTLQLNAISHEALAVVVSYMDHWKGEEAAAPKKLKKVVVADKKACGYAPFTEMNAWNADMMSKVVERKLLPEFINAAALLQMETLLKIATIGLACKLKGTDPSTFKQHV